MPGQLSLSVTNGDREYPVSTATSRPIVGEVRGRFRSLGSAADCNYNISRRRGPASRQLGKASPNMFRRWSTETHP